MSSMNTLEQQATLVRKFFERRNARLFKSIRHERSAIAARMSAQGLLQSGAFVVAVTEAYVAGFEQFAHGLIEETFDVIQRSGLAVDGNLSSWITEQLDPLIAAAAKNVCREASGGKVLAEELKANVQRAMDQSLAEIKRDLGIKLALALVTQPQAAAVIDEALLDPLVLFRIGAGWNKSLARARKSPMPRSVLCFSISITSSRSTTNRAGMRQETRRLFPSRGSLAVALKGKEALFDGAVTSSLFSCRIMRCRKELP